MNERRLKYLCQKCLINSQKVNDSELENIVANELGTSNILVGYRQMTEIVRLKYGVRVAKERVRCTLKRIDPEGVILRYIILTVTAC